MYLLFETSVGYALFKVDENKFSKVQTWTDLPQESSKIKKLLALKAFQPFKDAKDVLRSSVKMIHGKLPSGLRKFLKSNVVSKGVQEKLMVGDKNIALQISKKLKIKCVSDSKVTELFRCVRMCLNELVKQIDPQEKKNMSLSLSHGLGRFRINFSSDKVDTMIIQGVSLHQDLDKEINNYMMRLREWYGYHFPELSKLVADNVMYTKCVQTIKNKNKFEDESPLADIVGEDLAAQIKSTSEISIGTDISEQDEKFILGLCAQIIDFDEYRSELEEYLKSRINSVAPNLASLVGELIAAKLIAKAGSLLSLAKNSASTLQIMGAEKALFKAMKSRKKTPKYGIIYQTKLLQSVEGKVKGRMARALASKAQLCVRYDALAEEEGQTISKECNEYLQNRLKFLEEQEKNSGQRGRFPKKQYERVSNRQNRGRYNQNADTVLGKRQYSGQQDQGRSYKRVK